MNNQKSDKSFVMISTHKGKDRTTAQFVFSLSNPLKYLKPENIHWLMKKFSIRNCPSMLGKLITVGAISHKPEKHKFVASRIPSLGARALTSKCLNQLNSAVNSHQKLFFAVIPGLIGYGDGNHIVVFGNVPFTSIVTELRDQFYKVDAVSGRIEFVSFNGSLVIHKVVFDELSGAPSPVGEDVVKQELRDLFANDSSQASTFKEPRVFQSTVDDSAVSEDEVPIEKQRPSKQQLYRSSSTKYVTVDCNGTKISLVFDGASSHDDTVRWSMEAMDYGYDDYKVLDAGFVRLSRHDFKCYDRSSTLGVASDAASGEFLTEQFFGGGGGFFVEFARGNYALVTMSGKDSSSFGKHMLDRKLTDDSDIFGYFTTAYASELGELKLMIMDHYQTLRPDTAFSDLHSHLENILNCGNIEY